MTKRIQCLTENNKAEYIVCLTTKRPNWGRNSGPSLDPRSLWLYLSINCIIFCVWFEFSLQYVFCPRFVKISVKLWSFYFRPNVTYGLFYFRPITFSAFWIFGLFYMRPYVMITKLILEHLMFLHLKFLSGVTP